MAKKTRDKSNWKQKTLEELENEVWPSIFDASFLITTCHNLRKKPLINFDVEDLRVMIGQKIGLSYLVPIALERLDDDLFLEGHFYPGDLFEAVLSAGLHFWYAHLDHLDWLKLIVDKNQPYLKEKYPNLAVAYQAWLDQMPED